MQGGFQNPPVGNQGILVRPDIKSPNFVDSVSGWQIARDGSAEFNNLELRGTFLGTNYVLNSAGLFFYSGTPALGNLVNSVASANGTDAHGNAYLAGEVTYFGGGLALQNQGGGLTWYTAATAAGPWSLQAQINLAGASAPFFLSSADPFAAGFGFIIGQGAGVQTLVNSSTINTAGITMQPVTAAGSVTGIILQAGTFDGQVIAIPSNAGAGVTITFAVRATSNVSVGASGIIQPGSTMVLVWVASLSLWFPVQ